jgi:hypothetical protein
METSTVFSGLMKNKNISDNAKKVLIIRRLLYMVWQSKPLKLVQNLYHEYLLNSSDSNSDNKKGWK